MSTFWLTCAAVLVCAVTFLGLRGARLRAASEQSADAIYRQRRAELERDVADGYLDAKGQVEMAEEMARIAVREVRSELATPAGRGQRIAALGVLVMVVLGVAVPVYFHLGRPELAAGKAPAGAPGNHASPEQMLAELEKRAAAAPNDPEPRLWMARVFISQKQYGRAVDEFETVLKLAGEVPSVLVQYADALAMLNGGRLTGRPEELVQRALAAEPQNPTALWLAGIAAEEAGRKDLALDYLQRARVGAIAAEQPVEELDKQIAALGGTVPTGAVPDVHADAPAVAQTTGTAPPAAAAGGPAIEVKVSLDPALASKVGPGALLFVLAKRPAGMPMPLAVKRLAAGSLPVTVRLDDSLAMSPAATLSTADTVDVIARVSQQGQPIAASGDLEGRQSGVAVGPDVKIEISIDKLLP